MKIDTCIISKQRDFRTSEVWEIIYLQLLTEFNGGFIPVAPKNVITF